MERTRPPSSRQYSPEEAQRILERAAHTDPVGSRASLTLEDLERIAQDSGISPESVRQAADRLAAGDTSLSTTAATTVSPARRRSAFFGEPTTLLLERTVPVDLTPADLQRLAGQLESLVGGKGKVFTTEQLVTWTRAPGGGASGPLPERVVVQRSGGRVRVEVHASHGGLVGAFYGGVGGGVGVGLGLPVGAVTALFEQNIGAGLGVLGAALATGLVLARTFYSNAAGHRRERYERLLRVLAEHVEAEARR
jgi:hypothetical protein